MPLKDNYFIKKISRYTAKKLLEHSDKPNQEFMPIETAQLKFF
jgi:hypothetical protein